MPVAYFLDAEVENDGRYATQRDSQRKTPTIAPLPSPKIPTCVHLQGRGWYQEC